MPNDPREMSFWEHLEELRWRLIKSVAAVLVMSIVAFFFSDWMLEVLTKPIDKIYFIGIGEAFSVRIKLALFAGVILALPVLFYQGWKFVVPGLYASEVRMVIPVVVFATLFFVAGATFCFVLVMPVGIEFLMSYATDKLQPMIQVSKYISFVGWMTISFGVVFELPIISYFLGRVGIINSRMLCRGRRIALIAILIVAAIATPSPDVFSQLMLAVPLYALYEISIIIVRLTGRAESR
ncbi:MAG: twin-arginine translocase subunit TatC [candidate division Zixibacteria bacterium]|nr:twin-arginine translocase subunit TatC [candidate division Zixibacteria bacterium]